MFRSGLFPLTVVFLLLITLFSSPLAAVDFEVFSKSVHDAIVEKGGSKSLDMGALKEYSLSPLVKSMPLKNVTFHEDIVLSTF